MEPERVPDQLPRADRHRPRGTPGPPRRLRLRALAWLAVHAAVLAHLAHWKVAGTTLSPLEPSEAGETLELGWVNAGFVLFALLILATLVLGRFFCGWACHVVAYQDACAWLLGKLGLRPRPVRSRLLALVPAFAALQMFVLPTAARIASGSGFPELALNLTTDDLWARFPGPWIGALTFAVCGGLAVWLLGAKGFCTYGCPYGAVFGVADRLAPGRIRVTDACEGCGHCTAVCTSNVRVHEEVARFKAVVDPGCMKCLDCVAACPKDALYFGFRGRAGVPARRGRPARAWDFGWPEELALAGVFALSLWVWRGLYGAVPFLLSLGLSVSCAFAAAVLWRLAARRDLVVQQRALRRGGRLTAAGALWLAGAGALLALTAHGGAVRWRDGRAERRLLAAAALEHGSPRRAELSRGALADLDWLARWALVDTADLFNKRGSARYALGDLDGAAEELERALALDPGFASSRLLLADVRARGGRWDEALDELEAVLDRASTPGSHAGGSHAGGLDARGEVARRLAGLAARGAAGARALELLERARAPLTGSSE